jgi:poly(3-hydroxybutyrate) depolymerase
MVQYCGSRIAAFGFLTLAGCSSTGPDTPQTTAGANGGGSAAVAGGDGTASGGIGESVGASGGGGGNAAGGLSGGSAGAGNGGAAGSANGGAAGNANGGAAGNANGGAGGGTTPQSTSCAPARPPDAGRTPVNIQHDGNNRDYVLVVPPGYDGKEPLPLVVNLHGGSSFATEELDRSKWDKLGAQEHFVVVAPNGIDKSWNAGFGDDGRDDVGFIRAVVTKVATDLCIDKKRVFVTGHSNGGAMTHKLGCEAADIFAAMAPICGWTEQGKACNPARPLAVAAVRALNDTTVRYEGGGNAPSAAQDLQRWLDADQCADMPVVSSNNNTCTTHTSCKDETQVMECHPPGNHGFYYSASNQFLLPQALWPFFKQFSLP